MQVRLMHVGRPRASAHACDWLSRPRVRMVVINTVTYSTN